MRGSLFHIAFSRGRQPEQGFESVDPIVIRSHSGIQLCAYTVFPATPAKFLLQGRKYIVQ